MRRVTNILLMTALLFTGRVQAQLVIDSLSIEEYVQDVLLGSGVQATNISFTGCLMQVGYLQGGMDSGFGIESGIILASDAVQNIPIAEPSYWMNPTECPTTSGEPDLLSIANSVPPLIGQSFSVGSVQDVAILEFDFVPTGDTLRFKYVFGSEEYNAFENTQYNDIFAFFLSGPEITGPYDAPPGFPGGAMNIAGIPESDPFLPITISSVNSTLNSEYYTVPDISVTNYDGMTIVLEAIAEVVCGETYHIKLAIADGSDTALGSFVILEEGSFSSNAVVDVNLALNVGGPNAETLYEDCGEAVLTFTRPPISSLDVEDMVIVEWGGTATMGVDYTNMPDTILFPIGVSEIVLDIDAFVDGSIEGVETVSLAILNLGACNGSGLVSNFEFFINDFPEPLQVADFTTVICAGDTIALIPEITGGYGNYVYDWSTGSNADTIFVHPTATTDYFLTVSDTCGMPSDDAVFNIQVLTYPPLEVSITNGDILLECNGTVDVLAQAQGGDGIYTYSWFDENGNNLWGWNNSLFYGSWNGEGEINVEVTDGCGFTATDMVTVTLNVPDLIIDVPATVAVQCNTNEVIVADVSGGQPTYSYQWQLNGVFDWAQWSNTFNFTANEPGVVTLTVFDGCGQSQITNIPYTIEAPEVTFDLPETATGDCTTMISLTPTNIQGSGGYAYLWTSNGTTLGTTATLTDNYAGDTVVNLTISDACSASTTKSVEIDIVNPGINLDLGPDVVVSCLDTTLVVPTLSGGSGAFTFAWIIADTLYSDDNTIELQTFETLPVQLAVTDLCGTVATDVKVLQILDLPITIITSPDTSVCRGALVPLFANASGGEGDLDLQWSHTGLDTSFVNFPGFAESQTIEITATDVCGREATASIFVDVQSVEAIFTQEEIDDDLYLFTSYSTPEDEIFSAIWLIDGEIVAGGATFEHQFDGLDTYNVELKVYNEIGCMSSTNSDILPSPIVYMPNSFTPNGDGINDVFKVEANGDAIFKLQIFNRWGDIVFETTDSEKVWLGDNDQAADTFVGNGLYLFKLTIKGYKNEAIERTGTIQVIR